MTEGLFFFFLPPPASSALWFPSPFRPRSPRGSPQAKQSCLAKHLKLLACKVPFPSMSFHYGCRNDAFPPENPRISLASGISFMSEAHRQASPYQHHRHDSPSVSYTPPFPARVVVTQRRPTGSQVVWADLRASRRQWTC